MSTVRQKKVIAPVRTQKFEIAETWTAFEVGYTKSAVEGHWYNLDGRTITISLQPSTGDWQTLTITSEAQLTAPEDTPAKKELFRRDIRSELDPILLLHYGSGGKGWYLELYLQPNRDLGTSSLSRIIVVQMGPRREGLEKLEMGRDSKLRIIGDLAQRIKLAKRASELEQQAPKAKLEIDEEAEEAEAEVDEQAEARARRVAERASKPKPKLTELQKELADHNTPPMGTQGARPLDGVKVTPPDHNLPCYEKIGFKKAEHFEKLEDAGARVLGRSSKKSLSVRSAYEELGKLNRELAEREAPGRLLSASNQFGNSSTIPAPPTPAAKSTKRKRSDISPLASTTGGPHLISTSTFKNPRKAVSQSRKTKLDRALAKLASHNELGHTEKLIEDLPSCRKSDTSFATTTSPERSSQSDTKSVKKEDPTVKKPRKAVSQSPKTKADRTLARVVHHNGLGRTEKLLEDLPNQRESNTSKFASPRSASQSDTKSVKKEDKRQTMDNVAEDTKDKDEESAQKSRSPGAKESRRLSPKLVITPRR